jgi:type I restriction enzyme S subunit
MIANWKIKTLDELVDSTLIGLVKNKSEQGDNKAFIYIKMHNITADNKLDISKIVRVDALAKEVDKYKLSEGDFLFNTRNSHELVGKSCIFSMPQMQAVLFNNNIMRIRFTPEVDSKFIAYSFSSQYISEQLESIKNGTTNVSAIYYSSLKNVAITYPLLPEQKRIVAILDEAFEGIDRAIANTQKNLANARELFESYLNAIFTKKGDGWVQKKLGDTEILQIIDGDRGTNYPQKSDFLSEGHCLFLNTKNVRPDGFNFDSTMFITQEKDKLLRKGKLKRRDVILTTRGTIGNIAIYDDSVKFEHIRINSGMLIFRPNEKIIKSEYLFEILRSSILKSQIKKLTSGAAQPQLPIKTLVSFSLPVPTSLEEQSRIISNLHELQTETQRLETIYRQKITALNELKQSILQKAFTGELTADTPKTVKEEIAA